VVRRAGASGVLVQVAHQAVGLGDPGFRQFAVGTPVDGLMKP
jgi:hypothetical protein